MSYNDFLEDNHNHHGKNSRRNDNRYSHHSEHEYDHHKWMSILEKIKNNPKLKMMIILIGIVLIVIILVVIIILLPLLLKLFYYINQYGIKGLLDGSVNLLEKLWNGTGK